MVKLGFQIVLQRVLPAFLGALGAVAASQYGALHSAFCGGGL